MIEAKLCVTAGFSFSDPETKIPHKHTSPRRQTKISALCNLAKGGSGAGARPCRSRQPGADAHGVMPPFEYNDRS